MPSSDYTNAVGGGLKLKGAKDAGVKKHKKKKPKTESSISKQAEEKEQEGDTPTTLQKALAEEEGADVPEPDSATKAIKDRDTGVGKTEAQRKHEEMRRKRVCHAIDISLFRTMTNDVLQLDDRLKREGVKTHKERVEELNKYLSGLSEHHDMPRIGPG